MISRVASALKERQCLIWNTGLDDCFSDVMDAIPNEVGKPLLKSEYHKYSIGLLKFDLVEGEWKKTHRRQ